MMSEPAPSGPSGGSAKSRSKKHKKSSSSREFLNDASESPKTQGDKAVHPLNASNAPDGERKTSPGMLKVDVLDLMDPIQVRRKLKKKLKVSSSSSKRRRSNDSCLTGWSGSYPQLMAGNLLEGNSDGELQTSPIELKALGSTGLSVFPREELLPPLTSYTTSPLTVANASSAVESTSNTSLNSTTDSSAAASPSSVTQPHLPQTVLVNQQEEQPSNSPIPEVTALMLTPAEDECKPVEMAQTMDMQTLQTEAVKQPKKPRLRKRAKTVMNLFEIDGTPSIQRSKSVMGLNDKQESRLQRSRSVCPSTTTGGVADFEACASGEVNSIGLSRLQRRLVLGVGRKMPATDEFFRKPFSYGWKRELVLRSGQAARGDVFFISPAGKKLRSRDDILPLLAGTDLRIENFCFQREPQGVGPDFELVRQAVPNAMRSKAKVEPLVSGKRVPKPKTPKGASPPPEGWTSTMAVKGNARVLAASNGNSSTSTSSARKRGLSVKSNAGVQSKKQGQLSTVDRSSSCSSSNSSNGKGTFCERCHVQIFDTREAFRFGPLGGNNNCYICLACCKRKNMHDTPVRSDTPTPPESPRVIVQNESQAGEGANQQKELLGNEDKSDGVVVENAQNANVVNDSKIKIKLEEDQLKKLTSHRKLTEEIELPGQLPPAQLLNDEPSAAAIELNGDSKQSELQQQGIIVVNGRKYLSLAGNPPRPYIQVLPMDSPNYDRIDKCYQKRVWPKLMRNTLVGVMGDSAISMQILLAIMKTVSLGERVKLAGICKAWRMAASDTTVWRSVSLKDTVIKDWNAFLEQLSRMGTVELNMHGVQQLTHEMRMSDDLRLLSSIRILRTDACQSEFVNHIIKNLITLRELNVTVVTRNLNLANIDQMGCLRELHINMLDKRASISSFIGLPKLTGLTELTLRGVTNFDHIQIVKLRALTKLRSLVLGSCIDMNIVTFSERVLPALKKLRHLRLENNHTFKKVFPVTSIMIGLAHNNSVERLELVNVDIDSTFSSYLSKCSKIHELLLVPKYVTNSAKTTHAVIQAISDNSENFTVLKLGLTLELLRVTATLCPEDDKPSIPVVRPVPGVPENDRLNDITNVSSCAPREWAFMPVERLESILHHMMPQAMLSVMKHSHFQPKLFKF